MTASKQKEVFLSSEGDAWFDRNHQAIQSREFGIEDPIIAAIQRCRTRGSHDTPQLLEVGCGEGKRLQWINQNLGVNCHGIEPSAKAVALAQELGLQVIQGTADALPYGDGTFDFLVFGFCLYLCDRDDLFRIAHEANRVLKPDAWLIIHDFYVKTPMKRAYHHLTGLYSFKMDYRTLFDWHPHYTCFYHQVSHHGSNELTDDPDEWVATSVLRKVAL
jgi:ubiquinone/menaquinone biosynthesis C-methylase UbiE